MSSKLNPEEKTILGELKGIRDENIKHLIRVQLRLDEVNRRKHREANHGAPPPPPPPRSTVSNSTSNINVPLTLRNSSSQSTSAGGAASRPMMKSLRPHSNGHSASSSSSLSKTHARLKPKSVQEASTAASASWTKPITSQQKYQISKSNLKSKRMIYSKILIRILIHPIEMIVVIGKNLQILDRRRDCQNTQMKKMGVITI